MKMSDLKDFTPADRDIARIETRISQLRQKAA